MMRRAVKTILSVPGVTVSGNERAAHARRLAPPRQLINAAQADAHRREDGNMENRVERPGKSVGGIGLQRHAAVTEVEHANRLAGRLANLRVRPGFREGDALPLSTLLACPPRSWRCCRYGRGRRWCWHSWLFGRRRRCGARGRRRGSGSLRVA